MKKLNLSLLILLLSIIMIGFTSCKDPEPAHEHEFSDSWSKDGTYHWHSATCGHTTEVSDKAVHTFEEWQVTKVASCTEKGEEKATCTICGYEKTEVTDKAAHDFTNGQCICGKVRVPEMVYVKGGTVTGALPAWLDESASDRYRGVFIEGRTVTLSDFYMGKYEVTQAEYASVMQGQKVTVNGTEYTLASSPSYCKKDSTEYTLFEGDEQTKRPVEGVAWYDAVWYCNALSTKEGLTPAYDIEVTHVNHVAGTTDYHIDGATVTLNKGATGYRLPTEAEWEYAARGGDPTKADWNYTFSGAPTAEGIPYDKAKNPGIDAVGWYSYNNITGTTGNKVTYDVEGSGTHEVGKKAANRLGLYDMIGNVREWCYDWFDSSISEGNETDPTGSSLGSYRVFRGEGWWGHADSASVSFRDCDFPSLRNDGCGFRLVRASSN